MICRPRKVASISIVLIAFFFAGFFSPVGAQTSTFSVAAAQNRVTPSSLPIEGNQEVKSFRLPAAGTKTQGFTARVTIAPMPRAGYIPVTVRLSSPGSFPADRRFLVRVTQMPHTFHPPSNGIRSELPITVSQGDRSKTVTRMIPVESIATGFRLAILEDGAELEGYSIQFGNFVGVGGRQQVQELMQDERHLQALWVYADLPDGAKHFATRPCFMGFRGYKPAAGRIIERIAKGSDSSIEQQMRQLFQTETATTSAQLAAPPFDDWRCYQRFDVIVMTWNAARAIAGDSPESWNAIRDWVLCGGSVVVAGTPADRESVPRLLSIDDNGVADNLLRKIGIADPQRQSDELDSLLSATTVPAYATLTERLEILSWKTGTGELNDRPANQAVTTRFFPAGAGIAISVPSRPPGSEAAGVDWRLARLILSDESRHSLTLRRGVDPLLGDSRFQRWLIPGVAQPPVYTFMGLLSLFAILVGPIAYLKTTRSGRGYLMFAIAPLLALLTTTALLGYGIVADGFGVKARIRQLTWVDGASGDAGERVRSTYFAGIQPGGLTFPGDGEILTYPQGSNRSWQSRTRDGNDYRGTVTVTETSQRFSRSFLPSREQRQFVVHRPRQRVGRLVWSRRAETPQEDSENAPLQPRSDSPSPDQQGPPKLDSSFDFEVRHLVVRDEHGNYWTAQRIGPAAKGVSLSSFSQSDAGSRLGDIYNQESLFRKSIRRPNGNHAWRTVDLIDAMTHAGHDIRRTEGAFERWLRWHLLIKGIPANSFVAVADVSSDAIAVESAELIDSVRLVYGTMP